MPSTDEIKKYSEKKHRKVYRYLKKNFLDCSIKYRGLGHDIIIQYEDNHEVYAEIKTCDKIVCNGLDHKKMEESSHPRIFNIHRVGRFKFSRRPIYPYELSQHDDLVKKEGWYIFFVGSQLGKKQILFGIKAKDVSLSEKPGLKQLEWGYLSTQSYPDWLNRLKKDVYINIEEDHVDAL